MYFVLDGTISSHSSKPGTVVRAHLRDPIVLNGVTVAAAGTPVEIRVNETEPAQMGNVDGSVDIYFESLPLNDGKALPLLTPTAHIDPHLTSSQANTQNVADTIGDIFIPYHYVYHVMRKGMEVTLTPGTVIRARSGATVSLSRGVIAIATPVPFVTSVDTPAPAFSPDAFATPWDYHPSTPKPKPSVQPSPSPSPQAAPAVQPTST